MFVCLDCVDVLLSGECQLESASIASLYIPLSCCAVSTNEKFSCPSHAQMKIFFTIGHDMTSNRIFWKYQVLQ